MYSNIPPREIFQKNQILTLSVAKNLIGKRIAITNSEYKANKPDTREFVVNHIINEWDNAKRNKYPNDKFANFQEYWASYMSPERIQEMKDTLLLMGDDGQKKCSCYLKDRFYPEPTFFGSDADREIYYIEL